MDCWSRLAVDVTHYSTHRYLSLIDCGPSRFVVWKKIRSEDAGVVAAALEDVFMEHGPPAELLLDNSTTFRSELVRKVCSKWSVSLRFRCAYRPAGNGIVERIHRTIKRTAARSGCSPVEAVFWYNLAPLSRDPDSAPSTILYRSGYKWRNPNAELPAAPPAPPESDFQPGDLVFAKPDNARCSTQWPVGRVTGVLSDQAIEVNGVPRHVADCRPVKPRVHTPRPKGCEEDGDSDSDTEDEGDDSKAAQKEPRRERRPPDRFIDSEYALSTMHISDCNCSCNFDEDITGGCGYY